MKLTARDRERLKGVHPDLVRVIEAAAADTFCNWFVVQGVRTAAEQAALMASKPRRTNTMQSRHIPVVVTYQGAPHLFGHAVDLCLRKADGAADWDVAHYDAMAADILDIACRMRIPVRWGGRFRYANGKRFRDGGHFELTEEFYPGPKA